MARSLRIDAPGSWHHVMHRGARRAPIFRDDADVLLFLRGLAEAVEHHGLEVHAYALMPNHFHLLVRSVRGELSSAMKHVGATYTLRANRRRGWDGPIFRGRFRSQLVTDERYLDAVFAYIHLNPIRAGLVQRLEDSRWTSLPAYLGKERVPEWLHTEFFRDRLGGPAKISATLSTMRKRPDAWPEEFDRETGWAPVDEDPKTRAPKRAGRAPKRRTIPQVLAAVARIADCSVADLKRAQMGPRANPPRRLAVWALSREAAYSHREIAQVLGMSEPQVAKVLWRLRNVPPETPAFKEWMRAVASSR
jgi:putative transposase